MTRRVVVVYHSGEVYNRDSVRWYTSGNPVDSARLFAEYHNVGDSMVYDSTLKLLDYDEVVPVDPNTITDAEIDRLNAECSFGIIRGSNYLHSSMEWGGLERFLNRLKLPFVAPGIGMQAPHGEEVTTSAATTRIVQLLAGRCTTLGVRGQITADYLRRLGVNNTRVVGCPSMFRSGRPAWQVDRERLARLDTSPLAALKVAVTLRREIGPDYTDDVEQYLAVQKAFILSVAAQADMRLFAQGELFEKFFYYGRTDLWRPLMRELQETGWASGPADPILDIYRRRLFFSTDIPEFAAALGQVDFATGFRVHGVLPALARGIPGVLVDYDKRTRELIESFGIPHVPLSGARLSNILEAGRRHDYAEVSRRYAHLWGEMRGFFEENGVPHRMAAG